MNDNLELIVVKRSGQRVNFNGLKIALAIKNAFNSINANYSEKEENKVYEDTLKYIQENYRDRKTINVEDIQDIIEKTLEKDKYLDVYKSFSEYRLRRSESRKAFSIKRQHKFVKAMEKIGTYDSKKVNGMTPEDGLVDFGKIVANEYTKSYVIDNKFIRAFEEGKIYIHNFDYFNLGYLYNTHLKLENFFQKQEGVIDFLNLLINAKHEINGEISIDNIDFILSKKLLSKYKLLFKSFLKEYLDIMGYLEFINYKRIVELIDKETNIFNDLSYLEDFMVNERVKEIFYKAKINSYKSLEEYMISTIEKIFSTLNNVYGKNNKYVISLGFYNSKEAEFIRKIIIDELKNKEPYKNVTVIFKIKNDTPKTLIEEISKLVINNRNIKIAFNENNSYFSDGYKTTFDINNLKITAKMLVCNSSINMARLVLTNKGLTKEFYLELNEILELVKNQLLFVFETIGDKCNDNYKVLFKGNVYDDEKLESGQKIRKVIKNGTLNINLIGLKELATYIDEGNEEEIINKVLKYINERVNKMSLETKLNFTLSTINSYEASRYFIDLDKTVFGLVDKITDKNSYDYLNRLDLNSLKDLKKVNKYQRLLTGGNEVIVTLPKYITNKKIVEIINLLNSSDILYASFKIGSDRL